jgi:DNA polymerase-3 subunit delta
MQLRLDQLEGHLARGTLANCYVVSGDEALLALEAQDAIRAAARSQGYTERRVLHADARMDWSLLEQAATGLSLFASRQLIELRLPSGKPGKAGAAALQAHVQRREPDLLTIVSLPTLDWTARKSEWALALQAAAAWIECAPIKRDRLPEWLAGRLARQRQRASREALDFLADRVEGNLLAAHQEIGKLRLLYGEGELGLDQVRQAVFDVARFDMAALPEAMLTGDRARILRLVAGLRAEGEPLPLLLWMLSEELRGLLRLQQSGAGRGGGPGPRSVRLNAPAALVERVLPSVPPGRLALLLARLARLDRIAKGLHEPGLDDDPWLELTEVAVGLVDRGAAVPARAGLRS